MWTEADMIPAICSYLEENGYTVFTELSIGGAGYGIADVVGVKFNYEKIVQRLNNQQIDALRGEVLIEILSRISDAESGTKLEKIEKNFSYSRQYLKGTLLKTLLERFFIEEIQSNVYRKINHASPIVKEMVAVEAKKEAWKTAVQQARRYQFYANKVYIAMLSEYCHRVDLERLRNHNIGLLSVNLSAGVQTKPLVKPRRQKPISKISTVMAHESIWDRVNKSEELSHLIGGINHESSWIQ